MPFIDRDNIHGLIPLFPAQILEGYRTKLDFKPYKLKKNAHYVPCGMGGSLFIVDLLRDFVESGLHIFPSRTYHLPKEANSQSLVTITSFSGNTEESIATYKEARSRRLPVIVMANAGKLSEMAKRDKVPFVRISDEGITQPRYSTGFQLGHHLRILEMHKLIPSQRSVVEAACQEAMGFSLEKTGAGIAKKLYGRIPLFYIDSEFGSVARISTIKVAENAKMFSYWNVLPETNHNEMTGSVLSKKQGKFTAVMLTSRNSHPRIQKRFEVLSHLYSKHGIRVLQFEMQGSSKLAEMLSAYQLADWISFYLSQEAKIDPSPIDMVERFKKMLG